MEPRPVPKLAQAGRSPAAKKKSRSEKYKREVAPTGKALPVKIGISILAVCAMALTIGFRNSPTVQEKSVKSTISKTAVGETVVTQDIWIDAPVREVWAAFTTDAGWSRWSSPVVKIDLKAGGTIKSHYTPGAKIGDKGTNTLHIINYVPERLLTLRAELQDNWPDVMKEDHENLMNILVFEKVGDTRTHIISYGVGYRDAPVYDKLLKFFVPANEGLYRKLKKILEADQAKKTNKKK